MNGFRWRGDFRRWLAVVCLISGLVATGAQGREPIQLHPDNPHYFQWRGEPVILITSGEHYGGVLNSDFDYQTYFQTLGRDKMNLTRIFSGAYCEGPGDFNIKNNTLAPAKGRLICPWARSDQDGYANGGARFDLTKWDPQYFARLKDFITEAGKNGVVVEYVLFCPFYKDAMWNLSPMKASNNINGVGTVKSREDVYTLKDEKLTAVQEAMVRKVVTELNGFDNLFYEICNEPYFGGVTLEWQRHIAQVIVDTEAKLPNKHLIAQNIANQGKKVENPDPNVSILNFHYAKPPTTVGDNYGLNRVIGDDETGFSGTEPEPYRIEAWDFIIAGGGLYNNLDYSFSVGHEDGTGPIDAPGSGGAEFRKQLGILRDFMADFNFIKMRPDNGIIKSAPPDKTTVRALALKGRAYALYVNGPGLKELKLDLPENNYRIAWIDTLTGKALGRKRVEHGGGELALEAPDYKKDVALRIRRARSESQ